MNAATKVELTELFGQLGQRGVSRSELILFACADQTSWPEEGVSIGVFTYGGCLFPKRAAMVMLQAESEEEAVHFVHLLARIIRGRPFRDDEAEPVNPFAPSDSENN